MPKRFAICPTRAEWSEEMAISNLNTRVIKILLISLITILISPTTVQAAGRTGNTVANTILSGAGVPAVKLGLNGDFYLDIKSMNFYGPKKNNLWPIPISLKGTTGPVGPSGVDGKNGSSANATAGSAGATGSVGSQGPAGSTGLAGSTGPAGATGAAGPTGLTGAAGATGATGTAGATGASGASAIQFANITQWTMESGTIGGGSESTGFGTLLAGKKYFFSITVYGKLSSLISQFRTQAELKCSDNSASLNYEYGYGFGLSSDGVDDYNRISFVITGTVSVVSNSNFSVLVRDSSGSGNPVILNGRSFIQEIGAIN
ncbi:MAG: hypothetical protein RL237_677 [Actinomycetota bacterium]